MSRRRLTDARTASVLAVSLALVGGAVMAVGAQAAPGRAAAVEPSLAAVPRPICGPGSVPETGLQGQVPAADVAAGKVAEGFRCNIEVVGRSGSSGGFKVERYVDETGRECAFYDTTTVFPSNAVNLPDEMTGVAVLDMTDPTKPVRTATLSTPAMQTPHESLVVSQATGLVVSVLGNALTGPGQVDVFDASKDCRNPVFRSTLPVGILGHESGFSPDGKTFWAASLGANTLVAVDLSNPAVPTVVYTGTWATHGVQISADGNRAYLAAGTGFPRNELGLQSDREGLQILDISEVQARKPNPVVKEVGALTWPTITIPQTAIPVTIGGKPYVVEVDEFSNDANSRLAANGERVGAARIIDISNESAPVVVSNIRLAVNNKEHRAAVAGDPDATSFTGGYAGHYCNVPRRVEPELFACSFLASGLRVFDIRNPVAPKEVAYFVRPVPAGGSANSAFSSPAFSPARDEVWYSDGGTGFWALKLTNGAGLKAAAPVVAPPPVAPPVMRPPAPQLPTTGLALPLGAGMLLLGIALALRHRTHAGPLAR